MPIPSRAPQATASPTPAARLRERLDRIAFPRILSALVRGARGRVECREQALVGEVDLDRAGAALEVAHQAAAAAKRGQLAAKALILRVELEQRQRPPGLGV